MTICGPNQSLTNDQVAQLMRNAGFPESTISIGVAVASGESSLQTGNCNLNDPNGGSFGLWQINGIHFLSGTTQSCAFDPQCATNYAFQLSNGGSDWTPWGAYTNGTYKNYLNSPLTSTGTMENTIGKCPGPNDKCTCPDGYSVIKNAIGNPICRNNSFPYDSRSCAECPTSSTDPITAIGNFFSSIQQTTQWLSDPIRIIKLVFGILLIAGSLILIALPQTPVARGIRSTAKKVGIH
jgi:hypothetical protein